MPTLILLIVKLPVFLLIEIPLIGKLLEKSAKKNKPFVGLTVGGVEVYNEWL